MGLIDALVYGIRDVFDASGVQLPRRSRMQYLGTVVDDSVNDRLVFSGAAAGSAAAPITNSGTGTLSDVVSQTSSVDADVLRFTGAAPTVTGIAAGSGGTRWMVARAIGGPLILAHENAGSVAANRITTNTGANVTVAMGGAALLKRDSVAARWVLVGSIGGGLTPGGSDGDLQLRGPGGASFTGLGGANGTIPRRVAGAWVADTAAEVPAGVTNDLIGLDGTGGLKNMGPSTASTTPGTVGQIITSAGGGVAAANTSTLDTALNLAVPVAGNIAAAAAYALKQGTITVAGTPIVLTPTQYATPQIRTSGSAATILELPAQTGARFFIQNGDPYPNGGADLTLRAPGKTGTAMSSSIKSGWIYYDGNDYRREGT